MNNINKQERFDRLDCMIQEGRLLRNQWTGVDAAGKERACLLAAISPEVAGSHVSVSCPADVIPSWLAQLTPAMDDNGTQEQWFPFVQRYSLVLRVASEKLTEKQWEAVQYRVRIGIIQESMSHVTDTKVLEACSSIIRLCEQAAEGNNPDPAAWSAAESAAKSAAWSAAESAAESAASDVAWSAAKSEAWDRLNNMILDKIEEACK